MPRTTQVFFWHRNCPGVLCGVCQPPDAAAYQLHYVMVLPNMITNKTVRERTGQDTLESIIRERRLRWFGHTYRMDSNRISWQVMDWTLPHFSRKTGRPRVSWVSWTSTVKKDVDLLDLTWDEALDLTRNRLEWRDCTARCASAARGRTKVKV